MINKRPAGKTDFNSRLSEIQINSYTSGGYIKFKISIDTLKEIAKKNNWINELDEFTNEEEEEEKEKESEPIINKVNNEKIS